MAFEKGHAKVGGRKANTPNKATIDIKALAQAAAPDAFAEAVRLAKAAETEPARLRAIEIILDRAYGKAHTTADINIKRDVRDLSTADILRALATFGISGTEESAGEPSQLH